MDSPVSPIDTALQHGPRPLPLFLDMLREETAAFPDRRVAALAGLRAYQQADRRVARSLAPVAYEEGRACLRDYGSGGPPVVVVPSLINPPFILDLAPENSLLRWLAGQGVHPYLLDWGAPDPAARAVDVTDHVEQVLLPLLKRFDAPPLLIGYCLGGTMAIAAACATRVAGLATIATPWHFGGFAPAAKAEIAGLWQSAQSACEAMGLVPMEVLQSGFWRLDPARTIEKYERFAGLPPESAAAAAFVALEDWANGGAPLTYAAGKQMFEDFFDGDVTGKGMWRVGGAIADPAALPCPAIDFVSRTDRIVPAASAARLPDTRTLGAGHVGMIVGGRARAQLWQPLADWLSTVPLPR